VTKRRASSSAHHNTCDRVRSYDSGTLVRGEHGVEHVPRWPPGTTRVRQAILARTFAGKLVPQDPADEPASALLEGIRAEGAINAALPIRGLKSRGRRASSQLTLPDGP
jgi:hypothetical protein